MEKMDFNDALSNLLIFEQLTFAEMACLLNFSEEFIEVARITWSLQNLFAALELKLTQCIGNANILKRKRIKGNRLY